MLRILVLLSALCSSSLLAALGLGEAKLESALGQPLRVSIPLTGSGDLTVEQIKVKRSDAQSAAKLGVSDNYFIPGLTFKIVGEAGNLLLTLQTDEPVKEPFIDMALSLRWPQGSLHRKVTLLLDPPRY